MNSTDVVLSHQEAHFKRLVEALDCTKGVYWIELHGHSVKVGLSRSGIGKRLKHHVNVEALDSKKHPAWQGFMRAAVGRKMTIRWQECTLDTISDVEKAAIAAAAPLWERPGVRDQNVLLINEPHRRPAFTAEIARTFDEWERQS